jgi:hypothetical protein
MRGTSRPAWSRVTFHSSFDVVWLNILNLSAFPLITTMFKLDPLLSSYFHDLRPHSVAVSSEGGAFVSSTHHLTTYGSQLSLCSVQMVDVLASLVKVDPSPRLLS